MAANSKWLGRVPSGSLWFPLVLGLSLLVLIVRSDLGGTRAPGMAVVFSLLCAWLANNFAPANLMPLRGLIWRTLLGIGSIGLVMVIRREPSVGNSISTISSLAGLTLALVVLVASALNSSRWAQVLVLGTSGAGLVGQAVLLATHPKYCPSCLILGIGFLTANFDRPVHRTGESYQPLGRLHFLVSSLTAAFILLSAFVPQPSPRTDDETASFFVGAVASDLLRGQLSGGLMLSSSQCSFCRVAREYFDARGVTIREVELCTPLRRDGCYLRQMPTPTFLRIVGQRVVDSQVGLPDDPLRREEIVQRFTVARESRS